VVWLHHLVRLCFLALRWCLVAPVTCHSVTALYQTASRIALRHRPSNLPIILGHFIIRPSLGPRPFLVCILVREALVGMGLVCWVAESHWDWGPGLGDVEEIGSRGEELGEQGTEIAQLRRIL